MATMVQRICEGCSKEFDVKASEVNRGRGNFHSHSCRAKHYFAMRNNNLHAEKPINPERPINPDGINTGNPLENTCCPISLEMLRMRYWRQAESTYDIGRSISFSQGAVRYWLKKAGITIRSPGESRRLMYKVKPSCKDTLKKNIGKLWEEGKLANGGSQKHMERMGKKGRRQYSKNCEDRRVIVQCYLPECTNVCSITPYHMKRSRNHYCCLKHANKHAGQLRKKAAAQARLIAAQEAAKRQAEEQFGRKFD